MKRLIAIFALCMALGAAHAQEDWQAGAGNDWRTLLAAAKKEGSVVVMGPAPLTKSISEGFQRDTGIPVNYVGGSIADQTTRLEREAKAGSMTVDIAIGGGIELLTMYPHGYLEPIKPKLVLPGAKAGAVKWFDNKQEYMLQISNWVHGWAVVNSKEVDLAKVTTWKDLLKPEFKGKIAAYDPRLGGPGQSAAAFLTDQFGIDFVKQLYIGQGVTYTRDSRQLVEWAVRGTYPVVLGAIQFEVERFKRQGMTQLAVPIMRDGHGSLTGGFSVIKLPKGAPHPNAAAVFLNWIASRPGHIAYAATMLESSTRPDTQIESVPDYVVPQKGLNYKLDQYSEDWYKNERPKISKALLDALGGR